MTSQYSTFASATVEADGQSHGVRQIRELSEGVDGAPGDQRTRPRGAAGVVSELIEPVGFADPEVFGRLIQDVVRTGCLIRGVLLGTCLSLCVVQESRSPTT